MNNEWEQQKKKNEIDFHDSFDFKKEFFLDFHEFIVYFNWTFILEFRILFLFIINRKEQKRWVRMKVRIKISIWVMKTTTNKKRKSNKWQFASSSSTNYVSSSLLHDPRIKGILKLFFNRFSKKCRRSRSCYTNWCWKVFSAIIIIIHSGLLLLGGFKKSFLCILFGMCLTVSGLIEYSPMYDIPGQ